MVKTLPRTISTLVAVLALVVSAPPVFAQTGVLARGMDDLVRLYESGNPKLVAALKHHIASGSDEVLVNIHLKPGVKAEDALPLLAAEGFDAANDPARAAACRKHAAALAAAP